MRFRSLLFISLSFLGSIWVLSTGCKKSNSSSVGGTLSATVNDTAFIPAGNAVAGIYTSSDQSWNIVAYQLLANDTVSFNISIFLPFTVGQPVGANSSSILYYDAAGEAWFNSIGHTPNLAITVTSVDSVNHKIAGTFSGSLYDEGGSGDSVVVTGGKFNTSYVVQ